MARVYKYTRSVDAVTMEGHYKKSQYILEDETLIRIKQEPSNACDEETPISLNKDNTKHKSNNASKNNYNSNKKTVCYSREKKKSRKRKRHERDSLGEKGDLGNMETLQENNDNIESYKRHGKAIKSRRSTRILNTKKQTTAHCKICFLEFKNVWGLQHHKRCFERMKKQKALTTGGSSLKKGKINCNFCSRYFKNKNRVQGHLFHVHMSDLNIDLKNNVLSDKLSNSQSYTPQKQIMRQTTLLEYMFPPEKSKGSDITNNSNNSNVHSQAIIKQEIDLNDNESDSLINPSLVDTSLQNEISNQVTIPNQPFVKIHVHSNMMKVLLGIDPNDSTKPSKNNSKNNTNSKVYDVRSLNSTQELSNEELSTVVNKTNQTNIVKKLKDRNLLNICKKCSVPLVRCDDKPITKLTLPCSTPSAQVVAQNNSTSLKQKRQRLSSMNVTITSTFDTPTKFIPKDSSSTNSVPKGISNSSTPSKSTMLDLYVRSNLNKQLANRQSSSTKIVPDLEEKISSEQTNAGDPETSSLEAESNLTNIQSTQPTIELKLKELRVSLIKLPRIKREFDEPTIYYCEHCELPFSSEKRKDKHIRKVHTTYISSICTARCNSKRYMLKHYLQDHCIWGCDRCCVCRKFFRSRLSLQQHLLLHCIKVIVSKNERCPDKITKCNAISKMRRRRLVYPMKRKEIGDVVQETVSANNVENIPKRDEKSKDNDNTNVIDYEKQAQQINEAARKMENSLEANVIFLSSNNDYEAMELAKEPALDPLSITNDSSINQNDTQTTLTPNLNTVAINVSNDKPVSMLSNVIVNLKQRYPCSICGKQFQKLEGLWQHKRTYTQSLQNFCSTCGLCFSNRKILRNHINSTHDFFLSNLFKYHCQFCNQGFRAETNLRIHELHYHAAVETTGKQKVAELLQISNCENNPNITQTMCNVCSRNFNSYERYQLHCMYYHKAHVFACHICGQIFQGLYMLHRHNKLHHYPESTRLSYTYHCSICSEGFAIETHLLGHMAHIHPNNTSDVSSNQTLKSSKKSYICSKCYLEFSTIMELMVHVEHYTDGGNYKCQQCHRKCCTLAVLNEHINLSHGIKLKNDYKCNLCNEILISSTSLLCHKKHNHQYVDISGDFTFASRISGPRVSSTQSNICNKAFPVIAGPEHQLREPQIRKSTSASTVSIWGKCNISCPICGVTFDTELFLKKHLTEYLDVGDYKCEMCHRRFASYEFLKKHMANHMKPGMPQTKYYCSVCNEHFQSSIVYESHVAHLHASLIITDSPPSIV